MQIVLPEMFEVRARVELDCERPMDDEEFFAFCVENRDLRIEREANGEIIIMPPTGGETGYRNSDLNFQLTSWSKRDGSGRAFESSTGFTLPDGSTYAPDASWVQLSRLAKLTKNEKQRFIPLCPDFVVELTSPSDRLSKVQIKMANWMRNGATLGWLIDADRQTVYIHRPGQAPERLSNVGHVDGEGPVEGFRLDLTEIWREL
jgi:Uma2 family endonuclease